MRASTILVAVVLLMSASAGAQVTIRPGQYEFTIDMKMAVPKEAQSAVLDAAGFNRQQKRMECITADQSRQAKEDVVKFIQREMDMSSCTMSNIKLNGSTLTFNMTCKEDNVAMTGSSEFTFAADSFTSMGTMKTPGGDSTVKTVARRVGDCK